MENLLDIIARALPIIEDTMEYHDQYCKEYGKRRMRELVKEMREVIS